MSSVKAIISKPKEFILKYAFKKVAHLLLCSYTDTPGLTMHIFSHFQLCIHILRLHWCIFTWFTVQIINVMMHSTSYLLFLIILLANSAWTLAPFSIDSAILVILSIFLLQLWVEENVRGQHLLYNSVHFNDFHGNWTTELWQYIHLTILSITAYHTAKSNNYQLHSYTVGLCGHEPKLQYSFCCRQSPTSQKLPTIGARAINMTMSNVQHRLISLQTDE